MIPVTLTSNSFGKPRTVKPRALADGVAAGGSVAVGSGRRPPEGDVSVVGGDSAGRSAREADGGSVAGAVSVATAGVAGAQPGSRSNKVSQVHSNVALPAPSIDSGAPWIKFGQGYHTRRHPPRMQRRNRVRLSPRDSANDPGPTARGRRIDRGRARLRQRRWGSHRVRRRTSETSIRAKAGHAPPSERIAQAYCSRMSANSLGWDSIAWWQESRKTVSAPGMLAAILSWVSTGSSRSRPSTT